MIIDLSTEIYSQKVGHLFKEHLKKCLNTNSHNPCVFPCYFLKLKLNLFSFHELFTQNVKFPKLNVHFRIFACCNILVFIFHPFVPTLILKRKKIYKY